MGDAACGPSVGGSPSRVPSPTAAAATPLCRRSPAAVSPRHRRKIDPLLSLGGGGIVLLLLLLPPPAPQPPTLPFPPTAAVSAVAAFAPSSRAPFLPFPLSSPVRLSLLLLSARLFRGGCLHGAMAGYFHARSAIGQWTRANNPNRRAPPRPERGANPIPGTFQNAEAPWWERGNVGMPFFSHAGRERRKKKRRPLLCH